jgi:hypothetical protein
MSIDPEHLNADEAEDEAGPITLSFAGRVLHELVGIKGCRIEQRARASRVAQAGGRPGACVPRERQADGRGAMRERGGLWGSTLPRPPPASSTPKHTLSSANAAYP